MLRLFTTTIFAICTHGTYFLFNVFPIKVVENTLLLILINKYLPTFYWLSNTKPIVNPDMPS